MLVRFNFINDEHYILNLVDIIINVTAKYHFIAVLLLYICLISCVYTSVKYCFGIYVLYTDYIVTLTN